VQGETGGGAPAEDGAGARTRGRERQWT